MRGDNPSFRGAAVCRRSGLVLMELNLPPRGALPDAERVAVIAMLLGHERRQSACAQPPRSGYRERYEWNQLWQNTPNPQNAYGLRSCCPN
jgi:hypothetical protein